jgi:hypothetical protein
VHIDTNGSCDFGFRFLDFFLRELLGILFKKKIKLGINAHYQFSFFYTSISISSKYFYTTIYKDEFTSRLFLRKLGTTAIAHKNKSNERRTCGICELFAPSSGRHHNIVGSHCCDISAGNGCRGSSLGQRKSQKIQSHCTYKAPEGGITHGGFREHFNQKSLFEKKRRLFFIVAHRIFFLIEHGHHTNGIVNQYHS